MKKIERIALCLTILTVAWLLLGRPTPDTSAIAPASATARAPVGGVGEDLEQVQRGGAIERELAGGGSDVEVQVSRGNQVVSDPE